jgi:hypothetical protein
MLSSLDADSALDNHQWKQSDFILRSTGSPPLLVCRRQSLVTETEKVSETRELTPY